MLTPDVPLIDLEFAKQEIPSDVLYLQRAFLEKSS
jgi:hypothetical protein